MAYREFQDEQGRSWRVWDTFPQKPQIVAPGYEKGWLSFETEGEKFRLVPIPADWEDGSELRLRTLLQAARERVG
jgi:hypothetical protein